MEWFHSTWVRLKTAASVSVHPKLTVTEASLSAHPRTRHLTQTRFASFPAISLKSADGSGHLTQTRRASFPGLSLKSADAPGRPPTLLSVQPHTADAAPLESSPGAAPSPPSRANLPMALAARRRSSPRSRTPQTWLPSNPRCLARLGRSCTRWPPPAARWRRRQPAIAAAHLGGESALHHHLVVPLSRVASYRGPLPFP
jgi:hypothetical protein